MSSGGVTPDSSEEDEDSEDWVKRGLANLYFNLQDIYHECFVVKQMIKRVLRLLVFCLLQCFKLLKFQVISGRNQPPHIFRELPTAVVVCAKCDRL